MITDSESRLSSAEFNFDWPRCSGEYSEQCNVGREYARNIVKKIRDSGAQPLLGHVCARMPSTATGVFVGFFAQISEELMDEKR